MSCRHCRERLSAYLDSELSPDEREGVQSHLDSCAACTVEYRALAETKRALASLGARVSREEIERLLQTDVGETVRRYANMPVSPRTITAAILSVIGLCAVTARLTTRESRRGTPLSEGGYLVIQPDTPQATMAFSVLEVSSHQHLLASQNNIAETCYVVPAESSVLRPAIYCGTVYALPTPPPQTNRHRFYFQASFTTQ
ncbi:anti-sigma factor family protein [Armatimonas rosea]|uniref:anti-sigma factor family protein n=1 Tax=Armatimonas rosea TaxID=685828 RepID=UPI0031B580FB